MSKFKNKYRIESTRLKNWDYSMPGGYFITIVTHNRENLFGKIIDNKMILNTAGNIAHQYWLDITKHFPHVELDKFVIMPNHVHGIIYIIVNGNFNNDTNVSTFVETQNFASLRKPQKPNQSQTISTINKFGPQSKNLGSIIRGFKIGVTKWYREHGNKKMIWQSRFHDHIIRNENELNRIRKYIVNNPLNWNNDNHNNSLVD